MFLYTSITKKHRLRFFVLALLHTPYLIHSFHFDLVKLRTGTLRFRFVLLKLRRNLFVMLQYWKVSIRSFLFQCWWHYLSIGAGGTSLYCSWTCQHLSCSFYCEACVAPWLVYTLSCTWTYKDKGAGAAPGGADITETWAAHGRSTLQRLLQHLDLSMPQGPQLHLNLSGQ